METDIHVEASDLTCSFDVSEPWLTRVLSGRSKKSLKAVKNVSFLIHKRETFALVGESGSGKSTVAQILVGLLKPDKGDVLIGGNSVYGAERPSVQMVFQDPYASLNPRWRVMSIIAEPIKIDFPDLSRAEVETRVNDVLKKVGLHTEDGKKFPHEFSGGQRQRISIARALVSNTEFIVADEPVSALDVSVQAQILNLMRDLQDELNLTYFIISHDMSVVRYIADRVAVIYLGSIVEVGLREVLFSAPRHPYTRMLLEAIPDIDRRGKPRDVVSGEIPNPISPPSGCAFHPRCPLRRDRCLSETPLLRDGVACHATEEGWVA